MHTFRTLLLFFLAVCFNCFWVLNGCSSGIEPVEKKEPRELLKTIVLSEVNYHPRSEGTTDGEEFEFVELKNRGETEVAMRDVGFTDGIEYTFSNGAIITSHGFYVLASNSTEFTNRYGFEPDGVYTGRLSNSGETIELTDLENSGEVFSVTYSDSDPWPSAADGDGNSLVPITSDASKSGSDASVWRASFNLHGSPGKNDPNVVCVNELLTHTDLPAVDAVELYNPNDEPVDISNWFLTDKKVDPMKYRIPEGTTISAHEYLVIDESDFNADSTKKTSFRFSEHGEDVYLFSDSNGTRSGSYYHGFSFGEIENGISFGRLITSSGEEQFVAQKTVTLGKMNSGPRVGPVVITEIMYHPANDRDEYVELKNSSDSDVPLFDPEYPENRWRVEGIGFTFPENVQLGAGEIILIISSAIATEQFRSLYNVPSNIRVFSKTADLSNGGDKVQLWKPAEPYVDSSSAVATTIMPFIMQEQIVFNDGGSWPSQADGDGLALHRKDTAHYGDDPSNWEAKAASPGKE